MNNENKVKYDDFLRELGIISMENREITSLSGGEKQRFGVIKSLIKNNKVIIADEPTGSLDLNNSEKIMQLLKNKNDGRLIIVATHNIELAKKYATRIITLDGGEIVEDERLEEVRELPSAEFIPENKKEINSIKIKQNIKFLKRKRKTIIPMILLINLCFSFLILLVGAKSGLNNFINTTQNQIIDSRYVEIESNNIDLFENYLNKYQIKYKEYYNYDYIFENLLKKQITDANHINFDYSIKVIDSSITDNSEVSCNSLFFKLYNQENIKLIINYSLFDSLVLCDYSKNIEHIYLEPQILNSAKLYISDNLASQIITQQIKADLAEQSYINLPRKIYCLSSLSVFYEMCKSESNIEFLRRKYVENTYFIVNSSSYVYYIPLKDLIDSFSYILLLLISIVLVIVFSLFSFLLKTFYIKRKREYALYYAFGESLKEIKNRIILQNGYVLLLSFLLSIISSILLSYLINPLITPIFSTNSMTKIAEIEPKGIITSLFCSLIMLILSNTIISNRKIGDFVEELKNE